MFRGLVQKTTMYRVFGRSLSTATATATAPSSVTIKSLSQDLHEERNLKQLVEKFKKASEIDRFRTKPGIYEDTVRRLAFARRFKWIREILEHQKNYRDITKEGFSVRLMTLYGKYGMFRDARKVFNEMPERNCERTVQSLNALLGAFVHSRKFEEVDRLFQKLPTELSIEPDLVTFNTVIKAFCEMGSFDSAMSLFEKMKNKGVKPDLVTFNTLLDGLYSKGSFSDGEKIWSQMDGKNVVPDIRSYNARLLGLAMEKKTNEAVELFEKMRKVGVKPDIFSLNALIRGFVKEDSLVEAKKWYSEIIASTDHHPDKKTFDTLIPFLCRKGDLKTALEVCKEIFNRRCVVGTSLLQLVVDKLMNKSMISEAKEIVELGKTNRYCLYKLNLPADDK